MKQLFQSLKTGEVKMEEVPVPQCSSGQVLIQNTHSLISLGTEKMLLDFGKANFIDKIRQQPEKVQQVITKINTDGLIPTLNAVRGKLEQPISLGYSSAGKVIAVGKNITDLKVGDRVMSNGAHSEIVVVSRNLVEKVPDNVSDQEAAFTVVSSIALQGIRLVDPTLGETIAVFGLGLIGLITVQLLKANGCNVIGFDLDIKKVELAKKFGANAFAISDFMDPVGEVLNLTNGIGADGVLITASAKNNEIISQAAQMTRVRGRVVLVGVIGLDLKRSDFYEKEITFQVSCSYGPGRYDENYEQKGLDYPIGFARWTERRNFFAVLDQMATTRLNVKELITSEVKFSDVSNIYDNLSALKGELGILIRYEDQIDTKKAMIRYSDLTATQNGSSASVIGASQFAAAMLLPILKKQNFELDILGSSSVNPLSAHVRKKYNFHKFTSDYNEIFNDPKTSNIFIVTRHSSHTDLTLKALAKGKNVFVEKPLAITMGELDAIVDFYQKDPSVKKPILMVGFNRRFSPYSKEIKKAIENSASPRAFVMTVNAGAIPSKHWTQDYAVGGGRLVGEGCHFIDLLRYLSGSKIQSCDVMAMNAEKNDTFSIQMKFENGDIGTIHYFSNGNKSFPKERLEVFFSGKIIVLDNFKKIHGLGIKNYKFALSGQDKGHNNEIKEFKKCIEKGIWPIPFEELIEVSKVAILLQEKIKN